MKDYIIEYDTKKETDGSKKAACSTEIMWEYSDEVVIEVTDGMRRASRDVGKPTYPQILYPYIKVYLEI